MSATSPIAGRDNLSLNLLPGLPGCPVSEETALICGSTTLSYAELTRRVRELSGHLRETGVKPGDYLGIKLERSVDLMVCLLAVVDAGAAYIPLDPSYPAARLEHMVASSGLTRILEGGEALRRDAATTACGGTPQPRTPLYAIFTSGSTGQPKAASVFRSGFANLVDWYVKELALGPSDRTLVISSPSFDLTQKNFYAPLVSGGRLILDHGTTYDISRITALIKDHGVTLINCTPSAFYPLVEAAAADGYAALASLRFAVLGGEPISIPRLRAWLEHPSCRAEVVNSYGPTECTDICNFHRLHRGNLDAFDFVPLGKTIPNVEVTIRDENLEILADGEIGELCIAGAGVGGGYLNDPTRTAERFVEHGTLYKSGDLARKLPDGVFEFRGRADHQVKVNGFRIELGEIEIALNQHDCVREAVVIASNNTLIAFIQPAAAVDTPALREHLASRLPAYMVPGRFEMLDAFPLTPNGKVDRLALAKRLEPAGPGVVATDDSHESRILAIWSEVLGRPVTDATANFFDLGGTSINLAVVHVKLREATGRDIPITELFARPSARTLADYLSPQVAATASSTVQDRARLQQAGLARFRRPTLPTR